MRNRIHLGLLAGFLVGLSAPFLMASRNGAGTYSLPSGNPVVSGTTISTAWANNTLSDIGTELTDSLSRSGKGGMSGVLKIAAGTVSAPGVAFSAETNTGLYRAGSSDVRLSVNGADTQKWTASAVTTVLPFVATPASGVAVTATGVGATPGIVATGGATASYALSASSAATNGQGILAVGTGTGHGIIGLALDAGSPGAAFGFGGVFSGPGGLYAIATPGGVGAYLAAGTAATGGTRQDAVVVQNGDINLDQVTVPTSTTAIKNRLTASNLVKAYGCINSLSGTGSQTVSGGFNVASATVAASPGNVVKFTFAQAMADTNYVVLATGTCLGSVSARTTADVSIYQSAAASSGSSCTGAAGAWNGNVACFFVIGLQ